MPIRMSAPKFATTTTTINKEQMIGQVGSQRRESEQDRNDKCDGSNVVIKEGCIGATKS